MEPVRLPVVREEAVLACEGIFAPCTRVTPAYTLKALALAGAFYFFNDFHIRLKQHSIPGTIELQKVALISSLAGNNQQ